MLSTADAKQETMEPFVLFGSSFPKDKEYTQVRRHLYSLVLGLFRGELGEKGYSRHCLHIYRVLV